MEIFDLLVVGAGAAGCFTAAVLGELDPLYKIVVLEKTRQPLAKVRISGGGRCNVTHHCFDVPKLSQNYPRGKEFLQGPFHSFQPSDMIEWLRQHGVELKTESDGRMFPVTNKSQTIIDCFLGILAKQNTPIWLEKEVVHLAFDGFFWRVRVNGEETDIIARKVLFATGGVSRAYPLIEKLGHTVQALIPSLFTFNLAEAWLHTLSGSVASCVRVSLEGTPFSCVGPLLITHWGMSGPAVLRLSAFAARWLYEKKYTGTLLVNWARGLSENKAKEAFYQAKKQSSFVGKKVVTTPLFSLTKNLWKTLCMEICPLLENKTWAGVSKEDLDLLARVLCRMPFTLQGKSLNKEEFVTSGGVTLSEVAPKTMESKKVPGLYFAGEVLDIDGVTGGFNFQNAWTGGWLAAHAIHRNLQESAERNLL